MIIDKILKKIRIRHWKKEGLIVGKNFQLERNSYIDSSFPWLIEIGNDVTIAPDSLILSHDGSTKKAIGYSKIGKVVIGSNVFVGTKCIILPNTVIGNNVVIGAGSIVSGNIPDNTLVVGNPAKVVSSIEDFKNKHESIMKNSVIFDITYTKKGKINQNKKDEMKKIIKNKNQYIV